VVSHRHLLPALALLAAWLVAPAPADAVTPGVSLGKPAYGWTEAKLGTAPGERVEIRNDTGAPAEVQVVLTIPSLGLVDRRGQSAPPTGQIVYDARPITLRAGAGVILHFRARDALAAGTHAGTLAVFRTDAEAITRVPVTVTAGDAGTPAPASASQTMQGVRWVPLVDQLGGRRLTTLSGDWIPLRSSDGALKLEAGTYLGSIAGDRSGVAAVYATGAIDTLPSGRRGLEVTAKGFDGPGTYKGKLDLLPGEDGGDVELTVVMKDSIIWAVLALVIGIEAALRARRWQGSGRVLKALEVEAARAREAFGKAAQELDGTPWSGFVPVHEFHRRAAEVDTQIADERANRFVQLPDRTRDRLIAELDELERAAADLKRLPECAPKLSAALDEAARIVPRPDLLGVDPPPNPAWLTDARKLLQPPSEPTLEHLHQRVDAIERAATFADGFPQLAESVLQDAADLRTLRNHAAGRHGELRKVETAEGHLRSAWSAVWRARTVAEAGSGETLKALEAASRAVRAIAIPPRRGDETAPPVEATRPPAGQALLDAAAALGGGPALATDQLARLRFGDRWMRAFAYLIAIGTGLGALYVGKTFGAPLDYVQALVWGGATTVTLDALAQAIGLRSRPEDVLAPAS
jgi:hypothetical protein